MRIAAFSKSYHGRCVLELPALELPEGQITALIGANGSGKSTFGRVLSGVEEPDGRGPVLAGVRVGYLPQKSYAFRMSTEKNILLGGGDPTRAAELMRALELDALARQSAKKLSGGECAKMALCRMLMGQYGLLILDEPTAAMDMESTLRAEELIRAYCSEKGSAVLLVTHSVSQARRLADRVICFHRGKLAEQGETRAVLEKPQAEETKRFLEFYGAV